MWAVATYELITSPKLFEINSGPLSTRIARGTAPRDRMTGSIVRTTSSPVNRRSARTRERGGHFRGIKQIVLALGTAKIVENELDRDLGSMSPAMDALVVEVS